ncbi:hypothetical protein [Aestuariivirga sp.]|jgi:uncharacterized membrane protein YkoI|uniref:hypothetical protein n=1 Tax=Aestuariivirga sp. TaxID=2650926 RepID=UPI0037848119
MPRILTLATAMLAAALLSLPAAAQEEIAPSAAVKLAVAAVPGAEPLDVKRKGTIYVVKLKQGGNVIRVGVDAVTGDVIPMQ